MRVDVLGPLVVDRDGAALSPRGQRPRDVLAVLLQRRGRPVSVEVLLDLVWTPDGADITPATVHTVVARLRRQLGSDLVVTHDNGYAVPASTTTDEDEFVSMRNDAARLSAQGDTGAAVAAYRQAIRMWRSEVPYDGVREDLVAADRARLVQARLAAEEALVETLVAHPSDGEPGEAVLRATALAQAWPLREQSHRLAMLSLAQAGRQADALEVYARLRTLLREELGIDPDPATQRVHSQVLAQNQPASSTQTPKRAPPQRPSIRPRVPMPANPTIGRGAELTALRQAWQAGHRLITIHGPGGVGKSRLLAELARTLADQPSIYVDLSGRQPADIDELALGVLVAAGRSVGEADPVAACCTAIGAAGLTVLVDEAEWSVELVGQLLATLLTECPNARFVVTSRIPLELRGERKLLLGPLACPPIRANVEGIRAAPAVALLLERLRDQAPDLTLDDQDLTAVAAIARRVDGLPLALELLAAYAASASLPELLARSATPLDVSATDRGRGPRQRSLRETISWSVARMPDERLVVLRRLGLLASPFDAATAAAVCGGSPAEVSATVRALVREGLVQVDRRRTAATHYRMLRTVRDFALDALEEAGETEATAVRHRAWFAARWRSRPRSDELIVDVREHHDDYLEALAGAVAAHDAARLVDLAMTLSRYWLFLHWRRPALDWMTRCLQTDGLSDPERARLLAQRACLAFQVEPEVVHADTEQALPLARAAGDLVTQVTLLGTGAMDYAGRGELDQALRLAQDAVQTAGQTTVERVADALGMLSVVQAIAGDEDAVLATVQRARQLLDRSGSMVARIAVGTNLADALTDIGRPADALALLDDAATGLPLALGQHVPEYFFSSRGWAQLACGAYPAALESFLRVLDGLADGATDPTAINAYAGAAAALAGGGDPDGPQWCADALDLHDQRQTSLTPSQRTMLKALAAPTSRPAPLPDSLGTRAARLSRRLRADRIGLQLLSTQA